MHKLLVPILLTLAAVCRLYGATESYPVSGRVIDRLTRQPVPFAAVVISGQPGKGAMADSAGKFTIAQVKPGIYRLSASMLGYRSALTSEYIVSAGTPFIEIELEKEAQGIETVTVMPSPVRRTAESPVSVRTIGLREIEKSPGSNRDIARIVRSYPGVSFSPVGYRNDLIVRGGGPSENRFFMDGIEIPNINHFATQGASGGPVSLVNSDLIREIDLPMTMDFMAISSYGSATKSSGVVRILKDLDKPINGRDVLIIEDIVDSGMTLSFLKENLLSRGAASLHIATLLDKPERRRVPLHVDYSGFTIPDEFVVGYGLDYAEKYRNLPDIGVLRPEIYE